MPLLTCPDRGQLSRYLLGNLPPADLDSIAQHVETCHTCRTTEVELESVADSFVAQLRQAAGCESYLREAEWELARRQLEQMPQAAEPVTGATPAPVVVLYRSEKSPPIGGRRCAGR